VLRPANAWLLIDEHPDSINDGYFLNNPAGANFWTDIPGSLHKGAATVSFADGHAEIHQWLSKSTRLPVQFSYGPPPLDPLGHTDFQWLIARTAVPYP
jgi:prepilin-type processing-associated H-X9-DG protein